MADLYAAGNAYAPSYAAGNAYTPSYNTTTYKQTAYQAPATAPKPAPKAAAQPAPVVPPQPVQPKKNLFAAPNQFEAAPGQYAAPNQFGADGAFSPFNMAQAQQRVNAWRNARVTQGGPRSRPTGLLQSGMRPGGWL